MVPIAVVGALMWWGGPNRNERVLPEEEFVSSYRVVYDVREHDAAARTEERIVMRPYWSKTVSERDGVVLSGSITNDEGRWLLLDERGWQLRDERRQAPPDDVRAIDALEAALGDGRAQKRGSAVVVGRRCTVVRTGGPVGDALKAATADEHADLCVDRTGVVLRERWVVGGRVARTMEATAFEVDPPSLTAADFRPSPAPAPTSDDEPGVVRVRPLSDDESLPIATPVRGVKGYGADGPVVAVERNPGGFGIEISYTQAFVRDARLVVAEQGPLPRQFVPKGEAIDLGRSMSGYLDAGLASSSLIVPIGDDYLRFRGGDLAVLEAFASDVVRRLD